MMMVMMMRLRRRGRLLLLLLMLMLMLMVMKKMMMLKARLGGGRAGRRHQIIRLIEQRRLCLRGYGRGCGTAATAIATTGGRGCGRE